MDRITLEDIAKKSGVSIKTVSRVLNNEKYVQEKTRKNILKIIKELNYIPSRVARSLSKGQTKNIGFIIPDITNPFFPEIVKGASDLLFSKGYYVHLCNSDNDPKKEEIYIKDLQSMWVDGIIIAPSDTENRNIKIFNSIASPFIVVDREIEGLKKDLIIVNNKKSAYEAVSYLIRNGHKKIILLNGLKYTITAQNRFIGWKMALEENNLFRKEFVFWENYSIDAGYEMMSEVFKKIGLMDAVFAANDLIALGAMQAIEKRGYKIPNDVSVMGFDDIYLSKFLKPPLTTVRQPIYEIGKRAAELLLSRISSKEKFIPQKIVIEGKLIVRSSVSKKD